MFSIALTTYDRHQSLIETLLSITKQTFADFEIIVGNDNPAREVTASTLAIDDPRIRFINHATNLGEFENMNTLLRMSRGRYFTWIADDDLYAPDFLQTVHQALCKYDFPDCLFTSFQVLQNTELVDRGKTFSGETTLYTGREFLRRFLAREIETIGTMGVIETNYLKSQDGLGDVSADGKGYYCEYLQILRAASQEHVCYIDAPLMYFRVHDSSWTVVNTDTDQYKRALRSLIASGIEVFRTPTMIEDFDQNLTNILRWFLGEFVAFFRRRGGVRFMTLFKFFFSARDYISSLRGSALYWRAVRCLLTAEAGLFGDVCKQKFLATAPEWMIRFAYSVRRILFDRPRPPRLPDKGGNTLESRVG
jgi:glycosyltransferase involved in cell wall biosynthesis